MRAVAFAAALLVAGLAIAYRTLVYVEPPELPALSGELRSGSLRFGDLDRSWSLYVPRRLAARPALVLALHGSMGDGEQMREGSFRAFDALADRDGFAVAYPDGFEQHWNDCRRVAPYRANTLDVDDVGFLRALVARFAEDHGADRARVFATGISNGGQMALRLALEAPDFVRAVAPVVASLPAGGNLDCKQAGRPVSTLIMNGTSDPMNPWAGGDVALYGWIGNRGAVLSTEDSIDYFRDIGGHLGPPDVTALPDLTPDDGSTVEVRRWSAPGKREVALYVIRNGGHNAPHPRLRVPRLLGPTNQDISAAREIWRFFADAP